MTLRSRTTIRDVRTSKLAPVHPGEVLLEEFLKPFGISQYRLSKDIQVPPRRINEIVHGTRAISADTALRLARYFGTSALFWTNLQARHDLEVQRDKSGARIDKDIARFVPADASAWQALEHIGKTIGRGWRSRKTGAELLSKSRR